MDLTAVFCKLLAQHDYVSLPGLGSFVRSYQPAAISSDGQRIVPPSESYTFDPTRTFDDGALERYLHNAYSLNTQEAAEQIKQLVNQISIDLSNGQAVNFAGIGTIKAMSDGSIGMEPHTTQCTSTFGLSEFNVEAKKMPDPGVVAAPVAAATTIPTPTPVPTPTPTPAPTPRPASIQFTNESHTGRWIGLAAALLAVAAIVIFVLLYDPLHFWNNEPTEPPAIAEATISDDKSQPEEMDEVATQSANEVDISTDQKTALHYAEESTQNSQTHYIVVGSYSQKTNATRQFDALSAKGYKPTLLQDEQNYRVALYKFTNRDRALRELERLRAQNISSTVWLYSE